MIDDKVWKDYDISGSISQKLEKLRSWIPSGVISILDVGCGNGIITNALAENYDVSAVDISEEALSYVNTRKILASATDIPLPDNSFDLVHSSEMLEHLSDKDLLLAVSELKRLTKKYLIISVPNQEQLAKTEVRCANCGNIYHAYGHLHSFSLKRLLTLFEGYKYVQHLCFGPRERDYVPVLLWIRKRLGGQYFHPESISVCPQCLKHDFIQRSNPISMACNLLNRYAGRKKPYWLMLMLEKR